MDSHGKEGLPFRHLERGVLEEIQGVAIFRALIDIQRLPPLAGHRFFAHKGVIDRELLLPVRRDGFDADVLPRLQARHQFFLLLCQGLEGPGQLQPHPYRVPAYPIKSRFHIHRLQRWA